ncbi:MAG: hypothetical protein COS26_02320, partial [Candidatus Nealsonbacteria bacterium CG02_land_8_20_14_3_00_40_11]
MENVFFLGICLKSNKNEKDNCKMKPVKKKIGKIGKVLLIDPKGFGSGLNLGLGYLAASLTKNGYKVKVADCNNDFDRLSSGPKINFFITGVSEWHQKIDKALAWEPDLIGISINSFSLDNSIEIIRYCQSLAEEEVVYIAGGPHVTMFRKEFLKKNKDLFDFAVVGEGEETILDLIRNISNPRKVKGIVFYDYKKKTFVETATRPLIANLDSLPFPNFGVFDSVDPKKGLYNYQMISSRGCPYKCVFCNHLWSSKWRARSPENITREIKEIKKKYSIESLTFWDDNFTLDIARAKKICDLFISERLNLKYYLAGMRADRVDEDLVKKLKESGCQGISIGIEDGDPKTFPFVQKGETAEQIEKTVRLIQKYKIPLLTYMVTGLINHSYNSFLTSLEFIKKLDVKAHWSIAFPFP